MNSAVVCYVADQGFLFPTLMSAIQARAHLSKDVGDVLVFSTATNKLANEVFAKACAEEGIEFLEVGSKLNDRLLNIKRENEAHFDHKLKVTSFGRLFLHELLPLQYTDFLYIDGDTQIFSSLDPLMSCEVPEGSFLAARDYCSLMLEGHSFEGFGNHVALLALEREESRNYFNAGVIRGQRDSWATIASAAMAFYIRRPDACYPYMDQGALNGACRSQHVLISSRWNFPRQLLYLDTGDFNPAICHFASNPKPWHGSFHSWQKKHTACYAALVKRYPALKEYVPRLSLLRSAVYKIRSVQGYFNQRKNRDMEQKLLNAEISQRFLV